MTKMEDIRKKSDAELVETVEAGREVVRTERFKDKFSRKAAVITNAKREVAQALTELSARRRNGDNK